MNGYFNEKLAKHTRAVNDASINKKFFKYMPSEPLGYFGAATNLEGLADMWNELYLPTMRVIPFMGETYADLMEISSILIDEDEIYDLIKGDMVFVLNDIREIESTYITYDYDEDFNHVEKEMTRRETLPVYTGLIGMGNERITSKLLDMLERVPDVEKRGDYYVLPSNMNVMAMNTYVAWYNEVIIVTNDEKLVSEYLKSGLPKSQQLGSIHKKLLGKNNLVSWWSTSKTIDKLKHLKELSHDEELLTVMTKSASTFGEVKVTGINWDGGKMVSEIEIGLNDSKENGMKTIFDYLMYLVDLEAGQH